MKKVLIFAGGTGSIALQTGLHQLYGNSLKVDVVISAYDNGKSTGECRKRTTMEELQQVTSQCREMFVEKTQDYGASWRIMRPKSIN